MYTDEPMVRFDGHPLGLSNTSEVVLILKLTVESIVCVVYCLIMDVVVIFVIRAPGIIHLVCVGSMVMVVVVVFVIVMVVVDVFMLKYSVEMITGCGEGKQVYVEVGNTVYVLCEGDKICVLFTVTTDGSSVTLTNALSKTSLPLTTGPLILKFNDKETAVRFILAT